MLWKCGPWRVLVTMSSTSSVVFAGRMISAYRHIIFQPGVLGDDALDLRILESIDGPVAVVPAGDAAGGIRPDHVDFRPALFLGDGIGIFDELVFSLRLPGRRCRMKVNRRFEDGILDQGLRDELFAPGIDSSAAGDS